MTLTVAGCGAFDGLDLVEPGVVPCPRWKPDTPDADAPPGETAAYCGVARKR